MYKCAQQELDCILPLKAQLKHFNSLSLSFGAEDPHTRNQFFLMSHNDSSVHGSSSAFRHITKLELQSL